ncbi:DUF7109 family protein [Natrarchaeobaculum aegyptiacum]|uniref:Uncharacterized protein n=1 Tax=Natrarchaeobaculum aegyptiacum TaxID=745377 RepID=A0A2Z2HSN1_9EURY|nr:hypothetical protein [Natrarchaeobaculum aegyptiacum]ARS90231.1 hypothetical protein B1756_11185 [Natrarchaeobaculum aegyptiacum]
MNVTGDELAGVVDLFGGLTRTELERALSEAAFRASGDSLEPDDVEAPLEAAREEFAVVALEPADASNEATWADDGEPEPLFVAGPAAFPTLPEGAEDLPHIMDVDTRRPDREALGATVRDRFLADVSSAVEAGDADRCRHLLDLSYDLEAWAPIDLTDERDRLEAALE